jgi:catechol 2,3-dioxygenase-like lactoylglutathione lyase family enzyme
MAASSKPRVVGFNHVAVEVGDIDEALAFYGRLFRFELRGKSDSMAFIDLGDQFIALQKGRRQPADDGRHFGLVVDDKEAARKALEAAGVTLIDGPSLTFGTLGAIESRSSATTISSSPRRRMFYVAWV